MPPSADPAAISTDGSVVVLPSTVDRGAIRQMIAVAPRAAGPPRRCAVSHRRADGSRITQHPARPAFASMLPPLQVSGDLRRLDGGLGLPFAPVRPGRPCFPAAVGCPVLPRRRRGDREAEIGRHFPRPRWRGGVLGDDQALRRLGRSRLGVSRSSPGVHRRAAFEQLD